MISAQKLFVITSWLFIVLSALLFLVPTDFSSAQGAAWTSLGVGIASHFALFAALAFDQITVSDNGPPKG